METTQTTSELSAVRSELGAISSGTLVELRKLITTGMGSIDGLGGSLEQCERNDLGAAKSKVAQLETELTRQEEQFNKVLTKSQKTIEKAAAAGAMNATSRVQKAAGEIQSAISEYKDVIANGIEKIRKAVEEAVGPVIEKIKQFMAGLIQRLKDLWERAKQSLSEIQKQVERIFGDVLLCVQTLISNGMTAFQQGKLAFDSAKAAALAQHGPERIAPQSEHRHEDTEGHRVHLGTLETHGTDDGTGEGDDDLRGQQRRHQPLHPRRRRPPGEQVEIGDADLVDPRSLERRHVRPQTPDRAGGEQHHRHRTHQDLSGTVVAQRHTDRQRDHEHGRADQVGTDPHGTRRRRLGRRVGTGVATGLHVVHDGSAPSERPNRSASTS